MFKQKTAYEVEVEQKIPIPDDEVEEKNVDLAEVTAQVLSKKSYMKKWRGLTDDEVAEELEQIAVEREMLETSSFGGGSTVPYPDAMPVDEEEEPEPELTQMGGALSGDDDDEDVEDTGIPGESFGLD